LVKLGWNNKADPVFASAAEYDAKCAKIKSQEAQAKSGKSKFRQLEDV